MSGSHDEAGAGARLAARRAGLRLREVQADSRAPAVVAVVARAGEQVWWESAGAADVATGRAPDLDTQFRIGSITKTFTAVLVLQARDAGRLDLDDRLDRHLPGTRHGEVTLRQLLSHLSGLQREPVEGPAGEVWETLQVPEREQLLADFERAERVLPPHRRWHYSNLAFALLGEVAARAWGQAWERLVHDRLLDPLEMTRTALDPTEPRARGYLVDPYADVVTEEPLAPTHGLAPAAQLWSSPRDLARWAAFLARPEPAVLPPATLAEMRHLHVMADQERWSLGWGLGLMLHRRGDRLFHGHDGAMPGFLASAVARADDDDPLAAVVLTNAGSRVDVGGLALELAELWLDTDPRPATPWRPGEPPPADVTALLGRWWSEGNEFVFAWRGGRLEARAAAAPQDRLPAVFERDGDDRWRTVSGREQGEPLRVVRAGDGSVPRLYWARYLFTRDPRPFAAQQTG